MQPPSPIPTVDVREADRRRNDDASPALLVDVRERDEFVEARIPGSVLVPLSRFQADLDRLPKDRPLLVVCRSGNRSAAVTNFLHQQGIDATNVAGGLIAWAAAGLPVATGMPEPGEGDLPE